MRATCWFRCGHDRSLRVVRRAGSVTTPAVPIARLVNSATIREASGRRRPAHGLDTAAERDEVTGHVRRAAQPPGLVIELDDGHRSLRRNAIDSPDHKVIEHQVANNQNRPASQAIEQSV
jgi:hypothetical protein